MQADTISIEIIDVTQEQAITKKGDPYVKLVVVHKNLNFNKTDSRTIMPFGDTAKAHAVLKKAVKGEQYTISRQKPGDFWNWVEAVKAEGGPTETSGGNMPASRPAGANKPQYETAEERAFKQVMIVRQSCLGYAVGTLGAGAKAALNPKDVIAAAEKYVEWVTSRGEFPVDEVVEDGEPE